MGLMSVVKGIILENIVLLSIAQHSFNEQFYIQATLNLKPFPQVYSYSMIISVLREVSQINSECGINEAPDAAQNCLISFSCAT